MKKLFNNPSLQSFLVAVLFIGIGFFYPWITHLILGGESADQSLLDESMNLMTTIVTTLMSFILVYLLWPQVQKNADERRSHTILKGRFNELNRKAQKGLDLLNIEFKENEFEASEERDGEIIRIINSMADEFEELSSAIIETTFLAKPELKNKILVLISEQIEPCISYLKSLTGIRGSGDLIRKKFKDLLTATQLADQILLNTQGK